MSKVDLGLSNQYLKFGVALLLLGTAMIVAAFMLEARGNILYGGVVLLMTGIVVYVIGRIAKAASSSRK